MTGRPFSICLAILTGWTGITSVLAGTPEAAAAYRKMVEGAMTGDIEGMEAALQAEVTTRDSKGKVILPLDAAIKTNQIDTLRWMLEHGGRDQLQRGSAVPVLEYAIQCLNEEAVFVLLDAGADVHDPGEEDWGYNYPAKSALKDGSRKILNEFARRGFDFRRPLPGGESPLAMAIRGNNAEAVDFLLDLGMNVRETVANGNFPLADAAAIGNPEIVRTLLNAGADPNSVSFGKPVFKHTKQHPQTALVNAVRRNSLTTVKLLLASGADPRLLNNAAILWADLLGNREIYNVLLQAGAPAPTPYAFLELPEMARDGRMPVRPEPIRREWELSSLVTADDSIVQKNSGKPLNLSMAIIPLTNDIPESAAILTAALSSVPGLTLLEREDMDLLADEQLRSKDGRFDPSALARTGLLKGADVVVFLTNTTLEFDLRAVDTSTGLIIFQAMTGAKKADPGWLEQCAAALAKAAEKMGANLANSMAVSVPLLTTPRSTPETDMLIRQFTTGLRICLGSQPDILVLDRDDLRTLAMESDLSENESVFFRSGLMIDGGLELAQEPGDTLTLTLRARTLDGTEKAVVQASGPGAQPGLILRQAVDNLISKLGHATNPGLDPAKEGELYFRQALTSYSSQLWSQAHRQIVAAKSLGASKKEARLLHILSLAKVLNAEFVKITTSIDTLNEDEEMETLANAMPLEFRASSSPLLPPRDYLDLSAELLDLMSEVIGEDLKPGMDDQALWEYLPVLFQAASLPLRLLTTISDQDAHAEAISKLQARLLALSESAIIKTTEWQMASTARTLMAQRVEFAKYWITDESRAIEEILRVTREASAGSYPYALHTVMSALAEGVRNTPSRFDTRIATFHSRLAKSLAESDLPHARLLGAQLMQQWELGRREKFRWGQHVFEMIPQIVIEDMSLCGVSSYTAPDDNGGKLFRYTPDGPKTPSPTRPWYRMPDIWPNGISMSWRLPRELHGGTNDKMLPDKTAVEWKTQLTEERLKFMAREGGWVFNWFISPKDVDPETLERWSQIVRTIVEKPVDSSRNLPPLPASISEALVTEIQNVLQLSKPVSGPSSMGTFPALLPEELAQFHGRSSQKNGVPFSVSGQSIFNAWDDQSSHSVWLSVHRCGFVRLGDDLRPVVGIPLLEGEENAGILSAEGDWVALHSRHSGKLSFFNTRTQRWKHFGTRITARGLFVSGKFVVNSHFHPDGKVSNEAADDDKATFQTEIIDPETLETTLLISSRRIPPQSPLDNAEGLVKTISRPTRVSKTAFQYQSHVYDLADGTWRSVTKADQETTRKQRLLESPPSLAPWRGRLFDLTFDSASGMLIFRADIEIVEEVAGGKSRSKTKSLLIPVPPPVILLSKLTDGKPNSAQSADLSEFRFQNLHTHLIASSNRGVAVIPAESYVPLIQDWLRENNIPENPLDQKK